MYPVYTVLDSCMQHSKSIYIYTLLEGLTFIAVKLCVRQGAEDSKHSDAYGDEMRTGSNAMLESVTSLMQHTETSTVVSQHMPSDIAHGRLCAVEGDSGAGRGRRQMLQLTPIDRLQLVADASHTVSAGHRRECPSAGSALAGQECGDQDSDTNGLDAGGAVNQWCTRRLSWFSGSESRTEGSGSVASVGTPSGMCAVSVLSVNVVVSVLPVFCLSVCCRSVCCRWWPFTASLSRRRRSV